MVSTRSPLCPALPWTHGSQRPLRQRCPGQTEGLLAYGQSWALADHMRTELVEDALSMAFANRAPEAGVVFHSDRGCPAQYTSTDFADLARANGVVLSVGRKGECWDNAVAESFFATIKRELIDTRSWPTRAGLRRQAFEYIEGWYNTRRLHLSLGYLSPVQYEARLHNVNRQAA
jgi:putative transposase